MGRVFEGDEIDFSHDTIEAVARVRQTMQSKLQHYATEASLDDFIKSLHAWMTGGCEPVRILIEHEVEADLIVTAINADQTSGIGVRSRIEFSAGIHFRTGSSSHVRGLFVHAWREAGIPQGSIYFAPLDDVEYGVSKQ